MVPIASHIARYSELQLSCAETSRLAGGEDVASSVVLGYSSVTP